MESGHRELGEWPQRAGGVATENWENGHSELGGFIENRVSSHRELGEAIESWESGHRELKACHRELGERPQRLRAG